MSPVAASLLAAATEILAEVRARFPEHAGALAAVRIRISRRLSRSAGNADPRVALVQLSEPIFRLAENAPAFRNTVLHELAHIIAGLAVRPHGPEWRSIFRSLGGDGRRTHSLRAAVGRTLPARCARCDRQVDVGPRRHRRLLVGARDYVHIGCGGRIVAVRAPRSALAVLPRATRPAVDSPRRGR